MLFRSGAYVDIDEQEEGDGEEQEYEEADHDEEDPEGEFLDYDSEDGQWIPLADEDMQVEYEEEEIQWALANFRKGRKGGKGKGKGKGKSSGSGKGYKATRQKMQKSRLARGWQGSSALGKGNSNVRLRNIDDIKKISKCRLCHKVGHWQKECPNRGTATTLASFVAPSFDVGSSEGDIGTAPFFCGMMTAADSGEEAAPSVAFDAGAGGGEAILAQAPPPRPPSPSSPPKTPPALGGDERAVDPQVAMKQMF